MEPERIALSLRERDRLKVLHEVEQDHLKQVEAAQRLQLTDRHVRRPARGSRRDRTSARWLPLAAVPWSLLGVALLPGGAIRNSFRPTASRACGSKTETSNQNQNQIQSASRSPLEGALEAGISIGQKTGHFYFALIGETPCS